MSEPIADTVTLKTSHDPVALLTQAARTIGDDTTLWVRFPNGTKLRAKPILGDWMGGTPQRPWPDVKVLGDNRLLTTPDDDSVSSRARRAFAEVMASGQTCLDLARLERRLRDSDVPYTGGAAPTAQAIGRGYAMPVPDGWQGTQPAEGTRRHAIYTTVLELVTKVGNQVTPLMLADAVESTLLDATIAEEAGEDEGPENTCDGESRVEEARRRLKKAEDLGLVHAGGSPERELMEAKARGDDESDAPSGHIAAGIGPDGRPWLNIDHLIELLSTVANAVEDEDEDDAPEDASPCDECDDPDLPLWRLELDRAFEHLRQAVRWIGRG